MTPRFLLIVTLVDGLLVMACPRAWSQEAERSPQQRVPSGSLQSPLRKLKEPGSPLPATRADNTAGKIRRYAENLINRYDSDGDGRLTENEWASLDEPLRISDLDRDGVITADEFARRIITYGRRRSLRPTPLGPQSPTATATEGAVTKKSENRPTDQADQQAKRRPAGEARAMAKRYYVPSGRLPGGLAEWFTASDADGDGQVTNAELSAGANPETIAQFSLYDANGDGVITAAESLAGQKLVGETNAATPTASGETAQLNASEPRPAAPQSGSQR